MQALLQTYHRVRRKQVSGSAKPPSSQKKNGRRNQAGSMYDPRFVEDNPTEAEVEDKKQNVNKIRKLDE